MDKISTDDLPEFFVEGSTVRVRVDSAFGPGDIMYCTMGDWHADEAKRVADALNAASRQVAQEPGEQKRYLKDGPVLRLVRLRFFRDLIQSERVKVYEVFGIDKDDLPNPLTLGIEQQVFNQLFVRAASITPPSQETKGDAHGEVEWIEFRPDQDLPPTGLRQVRWRDRAAGSPETHVGDAAAIGWQYVSWWRPAALNPRKETAGVTVKPLEWIERKYGRCDAETIIGHYRVDDAYTVDTSAGPKILPPSWKGPFDFSAKEAGSLEDCKAAAQADYEQRILSALSAPQQQINALPATKDEDFSKDA